MVAQVNKQFQAVNTPEVRVATLVATLEELGRGASVGVNYYRGSDEARLRFSDFALQQQCRHILLTPQELADVASYVQGRQDPANKALLRLLDDAIKALSRANDYINECERTSLANTEPAPAATKPALVLQG
ncbi:MAG: hypothetical protein HYS17_01855 [Micavibrio aeruginosavorus]|uniref:Uncharacterized protein n=1 Tax=Micavibrio aeruginosavorus TaxID=349221 RepID=A0A7T5R2Y5_9BACT|nr:MAG: hypothetical protein HYS17_01855 [Micavibrio aeruginosavorus]